ncbi:unnamed protein product, partial [Musa banksii]
GQPFNFEKALRCSIQPSFYNITLFLDGPNSPNLRDVHKLPLMVVKHKYA